MGRADELRAQLAAAEAEETALAELAAAREALRADPGDPQAKAAAKAAAQALRATRAGTRLDRDLEVAQATLRAAEEQLAKNPTATDWHLAVAQAHAQVDRLTRLDATVRPAPVAGGAGVGKVG